MPAKAPIGALLTLLGAGAAIIGSFLPWAHVTVVRSPLIGSSFTLDPGGWNGDGNVVFGLGIAAAIIGFVLLFKDEKRFGWYLRTAVLIFGIAIVLTTFWDTTHVSERFSHVAARVAEETLKTRVAPRVRTRVSSGIILAAAGGVIMVFAAVIDRFLVDEKVVVVED